MNTGCVVETVCKITPRLKTIPDAVNRPQRRPKRSANGAARRAPRNLPPVRIDTMSESSTGVMAWPSGAKVFCQKLHCQVARMISVCEKVWLCAVVWSVLSRAGYELQNQRRAAAFCTRTMLSRSWVRLARSQTAGSLLPWNAACTHTAWDTDPDAMSFGNITHSLASQPLQLFELTGRVLNLLGLVQHIIEFCVHAVTITFRHVQSTRRRTSLTRGVQATEI
jgi:hypothetical protein